MSIDEWKAVLSTIDVRGSLTPITSAALDEFVESTGFQLPQSYREFCMVFGPGELARPTGYRITAPGGIAPYFSLASINEEVRDQERCYVKDPEQFDRACYFATDIGTSYYFWDPTDITNAAEHEYGIYIIYRDWNVDRLANSFREFVTDVCLGTGIPGYRQSEPPERDFEPQT